jgi:hypothetical protein
VVEEAEDRAIMEVEGVALFQEEVVVAQAEPPVALNRLLIFILVLP